MKWTSNQRKGPQLRRLAFRSRLEERIAKDLNDKGVKFEYEKLKLTYEVPSKDHVYTPDFVLTNGIIIEAKGYFDLSDRVKMTLVKLANPQLDIRLVFQRASTPIYKGSPTTYGTWATKAGFPWADNGVIPDEWITHDAT